MAPLNRWDAVGASTAARPHANLPASDDDALDFGDLDAELQRLTAANQELLRDFNGNDTAVETPPVTDADAVELLRMENAELKARIRELEARQSGQTEEAWLERQREYEMLLEEKSEVIRDLHHKIQDIQESAIGGPAPTPGSGTRLGGQAEEILRLKRELEEQRQQLEVDEEEMMGQMRQMELTMAKERAEMARQRQEVQRQLAELTREMENSARDPGLRERLQTLRRVPDPKQTATAIPVGAPEQKSSGFLRRIFG